MSATARGQRPDHDAHDDDPEETTHRSDIGIEQAKLT